MVRGGVELQRVEETRLLRADVDCVEAAARDREDGASVGLDEVGLVDTFLLDVRPRVVDALLRGRCPGGRGLGGDRTESRLPEPVRADEAARMLLRVAEQVAAGAEGDQLLRFRRARIGSRPGERDGDECRQPQEQRDASSHGHHTPYTSHAARASRLGGHLF